MKGKKEAFSIVKEEACRWKEMAPNNPDCVD